MMPGLDAPNALAWLAALAAIGASTACGSESPVQLGMFRPALLEGLPDSEHTSVFLLVNGDDGCSASLVAPNLLLTARHCVSARGPGSFTCGRAALGDVSPVEDLQATNPDDLVAAFVAGIDWYVALETFVPTRSGDVCGSDLAMVLLSENVPNTLATPASVRLDRPAQRGQQYTAVGYGLDEAGDAGRRLSRTGLTVKCDPGDCGVAASEFAGGGGPCVGDSGGPALDAQDEIIGVLGRGAADCSTATYTSPAAFRDFSVRVAERAAEQGGYALPAWSRDDAEVTSMPIADAAVPPGDAGSASEASPGPAPGASCSAGATGADVRWPWRWAPPWVLALGSWCLRRRELVHRTSPAKRARIGARRKGDMPRL